MDSRIPKHPRVARHKLQNLRELRQHLEFVCRDLASLDLDTSFRLRLLEQLNQLESRLEQAAEGRIEPRDRFKKSTTDDSRTVPQYFLFLDECGPVDRFNPQFPVFCLCGCVLSADRYPDIDMEWQAWKQLHLGSPAVVVHEPELRAFQGRFFRNSIEERVALAESLDELLASIEMACIAAVFDMREFARKHPEGRVDDFLPDSCYLMSIDFVLERFVHLLHSKNARGMVIAESRGAKEDAVVHSEFIRLLLHGTQYMPPDSFRHYLRPYVEFHRKGFNSTGLQLADLAARPFADKVIGKFAEPYRWDVFSSKLYDGGKSEPHKYGLKVYPISESNDPFPDLPRKAKESA